ncbi:MAG: PQQ-binding-like beta-propeller repeat protein [Planctomycetaceae bacterium]|nr:PQQ-binding-like beta-propeller repeat protein [Planctomycetaceae bacterium]
MSDRHNDAELIRICLEGTVDDLTDSVVSQVSQRIQESALLQAAVSESPISEVINQRLSTTEEASSYAPENSRGSTPGRAGLFAVVIIAVVVAACLWWKTQNADNPEPAGTAVAESAQTEVAADSNATSKVDSDITDNATPSDIDATLVVSADQNSANRSASSDLVEGGSGKSDSSDDPSENSQPDDKDGKQKENVSQAVAISVPASAASTEIENRPWVEGLSLDKPPRRFEETAWQLPGDEQPDQFRPSEFSQWFSKLPGKPFLVGEEKVSNRVFSRFSGTAQLIPSWVDSAVLRLGLYDTERCSITVWSGNRGVQLKFIRRCNPNVWAAYSVSRTGTDGHDELPRLGRFLASDLGRWHRSNFGMFDLRWNDGYLRLVRGDVQLLAVPLETPPEEVLFDGKLKFRDVRMFRSDPVSDDIVDQPDSRQLQNILATARPADLQWQSTDVPDGAFSSDDTTGTVRLATDSTSKKLALAFAHIPNSGLCETVLRVDSIDPGTGIYFGRPDGSQVFRISCVWDTAGKKPALWFQRADQREVERKFDPEAYAVPWTGPEQWIRIVAGYGITTVQMSVDGEHWGWIMDNPALGDWERFETVGVFAEPNGERKIQLRSISVNEFPTIAAAADQKLVEQIDAAEFGPLDVLDDGAWLHRISRLQPEGLPFADWRRACAVATLRARPRASLGIFLLNGILSSDAFSSGTGQVRDPAIARRILNEVGQLVSIQHGNRAVHFQNLYHEVARRAAVNPENQPSESAHSESLDDVVRNTASELVSLPIYSNTSVLTAQAAARRTIISLNQTGRRAEARQLIDEIIFWNSNAHPSRDWWTQVDSLYPTLAWAELEAHTGLDTESQDARMARPRRWKTTLMPERHPLAQPVSKEAYNVMAEFQAAIDGAAFQDACQVISSAGSAHLIGLLPDSQDSQLLVSFPNAVSMAMERYPQLRQQMNERFGAVGRLRVRAAIENGDYRQVESATIQFFGTPAAAESDLWLGDRALSAGNFAQARSYFERAVFEFRRNSQIDTREVASATARLKIVKGLIGESGEQVATTETLQPVSFGSQTLTADELTGLVDELSKARAQQNASGTARSVDSVAPNDHFVASRIPSPVSHRIEKRGRYEGDLGEHVGQSAPADTDWVSRQLAAAIVGDIAFLNNRFQVTCLDVTTGQAKWNQQLGSNHGSAHQWPMLAMRPLVSGDSIFCRRLTKSGTELVCCLASDGKIQWQQQPEQILVSDPFLLRGRLHILSTDRSSVGPTVLNLLTVQHASGKILSSAPVLKLFDAWQSAAMICQVAVRDAQFFVSTAGAVACCNAEGQTLWVRRREWTSTKLDSRYRYARSWSPPVIVEDQLVVGQPESPAIDCMDLKTGRLIWQHVEPELRRIIASPGDSLILETREGLKKISSVTGQSIWLYSAADLLDGIAVGTLESIDKVPSGNARQPGRSAILAVRHVANQDGSANTMVPTLVWIDAETGQEIARQRFLSLADREARVGPFLITKDRLFAFAGKNRKEGKRDIIEFVPEPERPLSSPIDQNLLAPWLPEFLTATFQDNHSGRPNLIVTTTQRDVRNGLDALCPGWLLVGPPQPDGFGKRDVHSGQKDVLGLRLQPLSVTPEEEQALADTPINSIRLIRDAFVPASGEQALRFKAGHDSGQTWNLTVDVNGQQIYSSIVSDETSPAGWSSIHTSLKRWAGQNVRIMVTCSVNQDAGQTSVFLSEMNSSTLSRQETKN